MSRIILIIVLVILIAIGVVFGVNKKSDNNSSSSNQTDNMSRMKQSSNTQQPSQTDKVSIENFAFTPANITVKKGTTVTWTNNDTVTHTVTESDGKTGPNSGSLDPGKTYTFTFTQTGSFNYKCTIHPDMAGNVTVTD